MNLNFQVQAWAMSERLRPRAFPLENGKSPGDQDDEAWHQVTLDEPSFSRLKGFILRNGEQTKIQC